MLLFTHDDRNIFSSWMAEAPVWTTMTKLWNEHIVVVKCEWYIKCRGNLAGCLRNDSHRYFGDMRIYNVAWCCRNDLDYFTGAFVSQCWNVKWKTNWTDKASSDDRSVTASCWEAVEKLFSATLLTTCKYSRVNSPWRSSLHRCSRRNCLKYVQFCKNARYEHEKRNKNRIHNYKLLTH